MSALSYVGEWLFTDKLYMTSIRDTGVEISSTAYWINAIVQLINAYFVVLISVSHYMWFYFGCLILIFRMRSITRVLRDPRLARGSSGVDPRERRRLLIECHSLHVEVIQ